MNWVLNYLDSFDSRTRQKGLNYHRQGKVIRVDCLVPGEHYQASVSGGELYKVKIRHYPKSHRVEAVCSCPIEEGCKHIYAALLQINTEIPQCRSPLEQALADAGVKMKAEEHRYLKMLQAKWQYLQQGYGLNETEIPNFSPGAKMHLYHAWYPFPKEPESDLEMWRYLALDLRRRGLPFPAFLLPVTEDEEARRRYEGWQQDKDIQLFRQRLEAAIPVSPEGNGSEPLDMRLMFKKSEARLQVRELPNGKFRDLKKSEMTALLHQGVYSAVVPEALPLLNVGIGYSRGEALYKFDYNDSWELAILTKLFRTPSLAGHIVDEQGQPFHRSTEKLVYKLVEPGDENGDYRLMLRTESGARVSDVYVTLPGRPNLYVTGTGVYEGPPPQRLERGAEISIPARALEGVEGYRFLRSLNVPPPPKVQALVSIVVPKVVVEGKIHAQNSSKGSEYAVMVITSEAKGRKKLFLSPEGWIEKDHYYQEWQDQKPKTASVTVEDERLMQAMPARIAALGASWELYRMCWRLRITKTFPEHFSDWLASLPEGVIVRLDEELKTIRNAPVAGSVSLQVEEAGMDWFDLRVALNVADLNLTPEELKLLLNAKGGYVRLKGKGWRRLQFDVTAEQNERLSELGLSTADFSAEPQRLHALQLAAPAAKALLPEQQFQRIQKRVEEIRLRVAPEVPAPITAQLRPYQVEGYHFLSYLSTNAFGGVLADDMGLGKTLQALSWLCWLRKKSKVPSLIVCPKSVMDNWSAEATRFWPGLKVRLWQGESSEELPSARKSADLIVANYSQLRALSPEIANLDWFAVILDEAQYIKNPDSQTAQAARALKSTHRLALTGTPIENRLLDLWSIFQFCMPGVLGNRARFLRDYNQKEDPLARRRLSARVRPFLLRRTKTQVATDLPDKTEEDLTCEMEGEQLTLYRAEFKAAQQRLLGVTTQKELNEQRFNFLTSLLRLRQICCHPGLVSEKSLEAPSAKLEALEDLLEPLMEENHKVLVFSQFTSMLDILKGLLKKRGWKHYYLAGETENRGELVSRFQSDEDAAVFLISLKAGGFGLNLTAASYVILFDPWWNPAVENQAIDRTHRIGQTSKVMAYRLLVKDSIEQKIRLLQKSKAALAQDILGEEKFSQSLTLDDLRFLFEN